MLLSLWNGVWVSVMFIQTIFTFKSVKKKRQLTIVRIGMLQNTIHKYLYKTYVSCCMLGFSQSYIYDPALSKKTHTQFVYIQYER